MPMVVARYQDWRNHLVQRIGYYCAYCNMPLSHSLQVEHVVPRNPPDGVVPGALLDWENLLLACGPCNHAKGNAPTDSTTYYLPESHNTHLPFAVDLSPVERRAIVVPQSENLNQNQIEKARRTIDLLALDAIDNRAAVVDLRSEKRHQASIAVECAKFLFDLAIQNGADPSLAAEKVARLAAPIGFFSLWYEAFTEDALVMQRLMDLAIIPGTAIACFDATDGFIPVPRNPEDADDPF